MKNYNESHIIIYYGFNGPIVGGTQLWICGSMMGRPTNGTHITGLYSCFLKTTMGLPYNGSRRPVGPTTVGPTWGACSGAYLRGPCWWCPTCRVTCPWIAPNRENVALDHWVTTETLWVDPWSIVHVCTVSAYSDKTYMFTQSLFLTCQ